MATFINSDIELDQIITGAIKGDKRALHSLLYGEWFDNLRNGIATRKSFKFGVDRDEIRDAIFDKVFTNIQDVKNPNDSPLSYCLSAWCRRVATSFCLNKLRRYRVEHKYLERLAARESMKGTRKSTEGASTPLPSRREANSPEEIAIEKEEAESRERIIADVCFEVKKRLDNASPNDIRIVILWGAGMTLEQISEATGIPTATVHRHLAAWQKPIIQEALRQQTIIDNSKRQTKIVKLIRVAIHELYSGRTIFLHRRPTSFQ